MAFQPIILFMALLVINVSSTQAASEAKVTLKSGLIVPINGIKTCCKSILAADRNAPSGEYYIRVGYNLYLVYCEMGLNGGGYTFLHPTTILRMRDADVQRIFTDRSTFLMRTMLSNGRQSYATLQQHSSYRSTSLKIGLNQYTGYQAPLNPGPYLFFGFLPRTLAARRTTQGIKVNGQNLQYRNCDGNGNNHIVLHPNFPERPMRGSSHPYVFGQSIFTRGRSNPSGRMMPVEYFMYAELHFGGCGCLSNTNSVHSTVIATTVGFR